jgi:hypothetical protein
MEPRRSSVYSAHDGDDCMRLVSEDGSTIEIAISGYQYPDSAGGWDGNWLLVAGEVRRPDLEWRFCDPCLTTWELQGLIAWRDGIAGGRLMEPLGFTEPNLRFRHRRAPEAGICIGLSNEAVPPWLEGGRQAIELWCPTRDNDPTALAASLKEALAQYPVRGE